MCKFLIDTRYHKFSERCNPKCIPKELLKLIMNIKLIFSSTTIVWRNVRECTNADGIHEKDTAREEIGIVHVSVRTKRSLTKIRKSILKHDTTKYKLNNGVQ